MTPQEFFQKWSDSRLRERQGAQEHFIDLCAMLGEDTPAAADPAGNWYAFERGAMKTGGGDGWADVWKKGCFAWECKGKGKDLGAALKQLKMYASALENPPLLIVSDMEIIQIHTNWTNRVQETTVFTLEDLKDARNRQRLKAAFSESAVEEFRPERKRSDLTRDVANEFVTLAQNLRDRGHEAEKVAHFVNRMVFCMFAEDVELLPNKIFTRLLELSLKNSDRFVDNAKKLFARMKTGGDFDMTEIEWFNGGLFNDDEALPLTKEDVKLALKAAKQDWSNIDPAIMGTLFERGLDPGKRSQLGAHYTDPDKIMLIVNPVIVEPLTREWETVRAEIAAKVEQSKTAKSPGARTTALKAATALKNTFIDRLRDFRVLDPACGSGNFLYLSLKALKDLEHKVNTECEHMGLPRGFPVVGPENVKGIEINSFAAELARVSVWVGEIQWMREHGFDATRNPILREMETIICHVALLNEDGSEYEWPATDVIVGNPPFLGAKLMKRSLGAEETEKMRFVFADRLPGFTDLVCYWFEKSRAQLGNSKAKRVGLVATNSIAKNTNLPVMRRIGQSAGIFNAWHDEPWVLDGAAVRVALVCFAAPDCVPPERCLNGQLVTHINPNLTTGLDISVADNIIENSGVSFLGVQKSGPFDIPGELARNWLTLPRNPNGFGNSDVLRPYWNGDDISDRPRDIWIIDLPRGKIETEVALFQAPFEHLKSAHYDPRSLNETRLLSEVRAEARDEHARVRWWESYWPRPEMRGMIGAATRYLVTGETTEYRLFVWLRHPIVPDKNLIVIARDDDTSFGVLQSRIHEVWSTGIGNRMGVGNQRRYNSSYIFETFPFPSGLTPNIPAATYAADPRAKTIAKAAAELNKLREAWLNPPDLVNVVPEVVPGYPDRILPKDAAAAAILKKRTLTKLYNERPAWLANAHAALDAAVAAAYGWPADLTDEQILEKLFALNQERAARQRA